MQQAGRFVANLFNISPLKQIRLNETLRRASQKRPQLVSGAAKITRILKKRPFPREKLLLLEVLGF